MSRLSKCCITFTEKKAKRIAHQHMMKPLWFHFVFRIGLPRGFWPAFEKLEISPIKVRSVGTLLIGLMPIMLQGIVRLDVFAKEFLACATEKATFLTVE